MKIEVCVETIQQALQAQQNGAHRVELCANLQQGGTTPNIGFVSQAVKMLQIDVFILIRPRPGHFWYDQLELQQMINDIQYAKKLGADGVVIGALTQDGHIDVEMTKDLIQAARPMQVTFHRAFDRCVDPMAALKKLMALGVDRLLTSGQKMSAFEGKELIKSLVLSAKNRILIVPGSGINASNILQLAQYTKASEFHFSVGISHVPDNLFKHPAFDNNSFAIPVFNKDKLKDCIDQLKLLPQ